MTVGPKKVGRPPDPGLFARRTEEILVTATAIFAEHGYRNTDVQKIADSLGVGKGTIYRYFDSKQALFFGAVDRGMRRFLNHITGEADKYTHPLDRLAAAVHGYLVYFDEHPELVELIIQERAEFRDRERPSYFLHCDEKLGRWHGAFRRMLEEDIVRDLPVETMFDCISNLLYGTMFTNFFSGRSRETKDQASDILDVFLNGILKERRTLTYFKNDNQD